MESLTSWDILGTDTKVPVEQNGHLDESEQEDQAGPADENPLGIIITNTRTLVKVSIEDTFIHCFKYFIFSW